MDSDGDGKPVETASLLGYIDIPIDGENRPFRSDSIIGSQPIPMDMASPIPEDMLKCKNCEGLMRLLVQCQADLVDTWYDRTIYVLGCIEQGCRRKKGTIRAIRGVKRDPVEMARREKVQAEKIAEERKRKAEMEKREKEDKEKTLGLFGKKENVSSNPFGGNGAAGNPFGGNPFAMKAVEKETKTIEETKTYAEVAKPSHIEKPVERPSDHIKLPEYPGYILYFESEVLDTKNQYLPPLPDNLKIQEDGSVIDDNASITSGNLPKVNNDKRGEDIAKMVDDSTFQNFSNVVSFNTGQVIRYELNGQPLLYSSKDDVSKIFYDSNGKLKSPEEWAIPSPPFNPSGERRFELQLMPKMIIDLERDATDIDIIRDGMEWGTIIVATDSQDFTPDNWFDSNGVAYVEEWCGVQWEEEIINRG